jgi:AcrR family transcriptional regulator
MPARPKFSREHLQMAALRIVDEQGLAALSMRALATALGTGPMTIYNYFRDRGDLDALLVEAVMSETRAPEAESDDWRIDVRAILEAIWRSVRAHPNVIPLILTRRTSHETTLEIAETLLRALARSGRSGPALLAAFRTLNGFIMGIAQAQLAGPYSESPDRAQDPHVSRVESLADDRFPKLREIAAAAGRTNSDQEFHAGLDIILAGLAAAPSVPAPKVSKADGQAHHRRPRVRP